MICNKLNFIPFRDKIMFNGYEMHNPGAEHRTKFCMKKHKGSVCNIKTLFLLIFPLQSHKKKSSYPN